MEPAPEESAGPTPALAITFAPNQDPYEWATRFAAGETSSEWPYGLNLQRDRFAVTPTVRARPTALALLRHAITGATGAPRRISRDALPGYAFSWDENLAIRSLLANPDRRQISGLIWADQPADTRLGAVKRAVSRVALGQMDGIFVSSSGQVERATKWLGSNSIPIVHIPMAVSTDYFLPTPYTAEPFVFSMGNDKHRDPVLLAEALDQVVELNPEAQVLVQTNRPEVFPSTVKTVSFLNTEDVLRCYRRASVVVIATRPNDHVSGITVALEAMSSARPVVMTTAPGLSDYIRNGTTGYLVDRGAARHVADKVSLILSNPELGRSMGLAARAEVQARFSLPVMNRAISDFITSIPLNR